LTSKMFGHAWSLDRYYFAFWRGEASIFLFAKGGSGKSIAFLQAVHS
jgi:hypothetical protein